MSQTRRWIKETPKLVGRSVTLFGRVETIRDHGKVTFIDLKDKTGLVQLVGYKLSPKPPLHTPVKVVGEVKQRPAKLVNPNLPTGQVEVEIKSIQVLNQTKPLPFPTEGDGYDIDEALRLKYRYLDLRRPRLFNNLARRSQMIQLMREYLFDQGFLEIETPLLTQSTPEGARDFLVPSRLRPGRFYALPQSPQQYKQMLMVADIERYFQIARCLRDEDPRADRGFEFTQLDIELSYVTEEEVMNLVESMLTKVVEQMGLKLAQTPFPRLTYQQAMDKYKADKFDLRTPQQKKEGVLAFAWVNRFPFFERTETGGWTFTHNPFSQPLKEHQADLLAGVNIDKIQAYQYDLVCNGYEVGGGSIRAHQPEILQAVFKVMGYTPAQIKAKFGHILTALSYGAPPHGGIALGLDRLIAIFQGEPSIKEVMAFPMTATGGTSVMQAPAPVDPQQLKELHLKITTTKKSNKGR